MMKKTIINEFEQYCDSLDENCPVVCLNALDLLKEQYQTLRIMFNRCVSFGLRSDGCDHCKFREDCEAMRTMYSNYMLVNGERVRRDEA